MLTAANTSPKASSTTDLQSSIEQHYNYSPESSTESQSSSKQLLKVLRRNERERRRVHKVNLGFEMLSKKIPGGSRKKLSKAETLRQALLYIKYLQRILNDNDTTGDCCSSGQVASISAPATMSPNFQYSHTQWNFQLPYDHSDHTCKQY